MSARRRIGLAAVLGYALVFVSLTVLGLGLFRGAETPADVSVAVIASVGGQAETAPAADPGIFVLVGACVVAIVLTASIPERHPLRRAIARGSREGRCLR